MVYDNGNGEVTEDCLEINDFDDNQLEQFLEDMITGDYDTNLIFYFPLRWINNLLVGEL